MISCAQIGLKNYPNYYIKWKYESSSNDTKFGVDLEHKILRHMVKILAKSDDQFQSLLLKVYPN